MGAPSANTLILASHAVGGGKQATRRKGSPPRWRSPFRQFGAIWVELTHGGFQGAVRKRDANADWTAQKPTQRGGEKKEEGGAGGKKGLRLVCELCVCLQLLEDDNLSAIVSTHTRFFFWFSLF